MQRLEATHPEALRRCAVAHASSHSPGGTSGARAAQGPFFGSRDPSHDTDTLKGDSGAGN